VDIRRFVETYALGEIIPDDLSAAADEALVAGYESPSLINLAAAEGAPCGILETLFLRAMDELGISIPLPVEAGRSKAQRIVTDIVQGEIAPYEGAKQIWWEVYARFPELSELKYFAGLAGEFDDDPKRQESYSRQIIEVSKDYLRRVNSGGNDFVFDPGLPLIG
jgi:hypothetical protein